MILQGGCSFIRGSPLRKEVRAIEEIIRLVLAVMKLVLAILELLRLLS